MVTPFLGRQVNYPMMQQLLKRQYQAGIRSFVIAGTTGESATLSDQEKLQLARCCKDALGEQALIILGTGSNDTSHSCDLSQAAQEAGANGLLVVSPYYNKATPEGLMAHYMSIAHSVSIPVILYNVPTRTGCDIPISVYRRLCHVENIVGVKEAHGDITRVTKILNACGPDFAVWSGNDDQAAAAIALGASGLISVASNLYPEELRSLTTAALDGDFDTAAALQCRLQPLLELMTCEVNPIPVKTAMALLGFDCGGFRLPLTPLSRENAERLKTFLSSDRRITS